MSDEVERANPASGGDRVLTHGAETETTDQGRQRTCPECSGRLTADGDETVCTDCGLVVAADHIDRGPEWRAFQPGEEAEKRRTGDGLTVARHDDGLGTRVGTVGDGRDVATRLRFQLRRMRQLHEQAHAGRKRDRNRRYAFGEIRRLCSALGLGQSIRDQACKLFRSAQDATLLQGRTLEGFAAACVYATCRCNRLGRSRDEVVAVARCDGQQVTNAHQALTRELGVPVPPPTAADTLPRLASEFDVRDRVRTVARRYVEQHFEGAAAAGLDPNGIAAACLYVAARRYGDGITQAALADAADVTTVTVRSRMHDLEEALAEAESAAVATDGSPDDSDEFGVVRG